MMGVGCFSFEVVALCTLLYAVQWAHVVQARVVYVDWRSSSVYPGCGVSLENACQSLSDAFLEANSSSTAVEVVVADGEYFACELLTLKCSAIRAFNRSARDVFVTSSRDSHCGHALAFQGQISSFSIEGLSFVDSATENAVLLVSGFASLYALNVHFLSDSSELRSLFCVEQCSSAVFESVTVENASIAVGEAAAIFLTSSGASLNVSVSRCLFSTIVGSWFAVIGEISCLVVQDCVVKNVSAGSKAPHTVHSVVESTNFAATSVNVLFQNNEFESNFVEASECSGVACVRSIVGFLFSVVFQNHSSIAFENNSFTFNVVEESGGAIGIRVRSCSKLELVFLNNLIRSNAASGFGGGINVYVDAFEGLLLQVIRNTFVMNRAGEFGAGFSFHAASLLVDSLLNVSVVGNFFSRNYGSGNGGIAMFHLRSPKWTPLGCAYFLFEKNWYDSNSFDHSGLVVWGDFWRPEAVGHGGVIHVHARDELFSGNRQLRHLTPSHVFLVDVAFASETLLELSDLEFVENYVSDFLVYGASVDDHGTCSFEMVVKRCRFIGPSMYGVAYFLEFPGGLTFNSSVVVDDSFFSGVDDKQVSVQLYSAERSGFSTINVERNVFFDSVGFVVDIEYEGAISPAVLVTANDFHVAEGVALVLRSLYWLVNANVLFVDNAFRASAAAGVLDTFVRLSFAQLCGGTFVFRNNSFHGAQVVRGSDGGGVSVSVGEICVFSMSEDVQAPSFVFQECEFNECEAERGGGAFLGAAGGTVLVDFARCSFFRNHAAVQGGGLMAVGLVLAQIERCTFVGNSAELAGGSLLWDGSSSSVAVRDCSFSESSADEGAVGIVAGDFVIQNCSFVFDNSVSEEQLVLGKELPVGFDSNATASCPIGSQYVNCVDYDSGFCQDWSLRGAIACHNCTAGTYILSASSSLSRKTATCQPCPSYSSCEGQLVIADSGFWVNRFFWDGILVATTYRCPEDYCISQSSNVTEVCSFHRAGFLCGKCAEYDEQGRRLCQSMNAACVSCADCHPTVFFLSNTLLAAAFVVFVIVFPGSSGASKVLGYFFQVLPIVSFSRNRFFAQRESTVNDLVRLGSILANLELVKNLGGSDCPFRGFNVAGYIALEFLSPFLYFLFFFVFLGLCVCLCARVSFFVWGLKAIWRVPCTVWKRANMSEDGQCTGRVEAQNSLRTKLLPEEEIDGGPVELQDVGLESSSLRGTIPVCDAQVDELDELTLVGSMDEKVLKAESPFPSFRIWRWRFAFSRRFTVAFVTLLLLAYRPGVAATLRLLNCNRYIVDAHSNVEWRLFESAEIVCWQWWQILLWIFAAVIVLPFPLYVMAVRHLVRVVYFPFSRGMKMNAVIETLEKPYRVRFKWWETVMLSRRLILLILATWVKNPYTSYLLVSVVCIIFLFAHLAFRPFADRYASVLESLSLAFLAILSLLNVRRGVLESIGNRIDDTTNDVLFWSEFAFAFVLCSGVLLGLSVQCLASRVRFIKRFRRWLQRKMKHQRLLSDESKPK